jgi:hypothetical protein
MTQVNPEFFSHSLEILSVPCMILNTQFSFQLIALSHEPLEDNNPFMTKGRRNCETEEFLN